MLEFGFCYSQCYWRQWIPSLQCSFDTFVEVSDFTENECIDTIRSVVGLLTLGIQLATKIYCVRSQDFDTRGLFKCQRCHASRPFPFIKWPNEVCLAGQSHFNGESHINPVNQPL